MTGGVPWVIATGGGDYGQSRSQRPQGQKFLRAFFKKRCLLTCLLFGERGEEAGLGAHAAVEAG
jgi:hypothetical protein